MYAVDAPVLGGYESAVGYDAARVVAVVGGVYGVEAVGEHGAGGYACRYGGFVGGDVYAVSQSADYHYAVERVGKLFDEAPGKLGAV